MKDWDECVFGRKAGAGVRGRAGRGLGVALDVVGLGVRSVQEVQGRGRSWVPTSYWVQALGMAWGPHHRHTSRGLTWLHDSASLLLLQANKARGGAGTGPLGAKADTRPQNKVLLIGGPPGG